MLKVLLFSLSRQYTVDGQYIQILFIEPEVRHDKTSYMLKTVVEENRIYSHTNCSFKFINTVKFYLHRHRKVLNTEWGDQTNDNTKLRIAYESTEQSSRGC